MMYFIFAGDMFVMAFMIFVVVWLFFKSSKEDIAKQANIPLHDEQVDD